MGTVVQVFRAAKVADASMKAVFFCQWAGLEDCLAKALQEYNISYCQLSKCRDVFERTEMIESFQRHGEDRQSKLSLRGSAEAGVDVMLLSYEHSASGTHLTAANHVFILHPLVAATPALSQAYERQAIGRVARLGQMKEVTVHRFIAANTVEAALASRISELSQDI